MSDANVEDVKDDIPGSARAIGNVIKKFPFRHFFLMLLVVFLMVDDSVTDMLYDADVSVKLIVFAIAYVALYALTKVM